MIKELTSIVALVTLIGSLISPIAYAAMEDDPLLYKIMIDQLELPDSGSKDPLSWEGQGWLGKDLKKLWIKTEGERVKGETKEFEFQALYSKPIARYWDFQLGARYDFKPTPGRSWGVIGLQGLAPYFFEVDAAFFIGESGRMALRLEAEYELLLTQRLILTPEVEVNFFGQNDPETAVGSGLSDVEVGLRLRYEIRREFAPYIGINRWKKYGNSADFARAAGGDISDTQIVAGVRLWF